MHTTESSETLNTIIEVKNFNFAYGESQALFDIDIDIKEREVTAFIGPSGCGKSTFLRCFNRMNDLIDIARIKSGSININGINIYDNSVDVIELRKHVGMVFQKSIHSPSRSMKISPTDFAFRGSKIKVNWIMLSRSVYAELRYGMK